MFLFCVVLFASCASCPVKEATKFCRAERHVHELSRGNRLVYVGILRRLEFLLPFLAES